MKALVRILLALQLIGLAPAIAASGTSESSLLALEKQRSDAILRADISTLRNLMDRYYRHVDSRGRVRSKTELLTSLERQDVHFVSYENESAEIQFIDGGKAAIIAGVFRSRQEGGKPFRGRFVRVWVREADGWKNTFHQGTEIRTATEGCNCK